MALVCPALHGQSTRSPYTIIGIGEFVEPNLPQHLGIGGGGVALPNYLHVNTINPALLSHYQLTNIQLGLVGDRRNIVYNNATTNTTFFNFGGFHVAMPMISSKWGAAIGLQPYTQVAYRALEETPIAGTDATTRHAIEGRGGINEAYMGHGIRVAKGVHVGAQVGYLFGFTSHSDNVLLNGESFDFLQTNHTRRFQYQGLRVKLGGMYGYRLGSDKQLSIGATYVPGINMVVREYLEVERANALTGRLLSAASDIDDLVRRYTYQLPHEWSAGIAYEAVEKWRLYLDINGRSFADDSGYVGQWGVRGGVEFIKNPFGRYFARLPYRFGVRWLQLPYANATSEVSLHMGTSLEIRNRARLDIGIQGGLRGQSTVQYARELYFSFSVGTTFTNKWFIRRRYD